MTLGRHNKGMHMSKVDSQILVLRPRHFVYKNYRFNTKEWANQQLRYAIFVLQGYGVDCKPSGRIAIALYLKDQLEDLRWFWQADRISNFINLYKRKFRDLELYTDE